MKRDEDAGSQTISAQSVATSAQESPRDRRRPARAFPVSGMGRSVELHVEELVLQGFPAVDRYRIGEAFERELTRLFKEQGAPRAITMGGEIERLDGGVFELRPGSDAETIGAQLAKAIYGRLGR